MTQTEIELAMEAHRRRESKRQTKRALIVVFGIIPASLLTATTLFLLSQVIL